MKGRYAQLITKLQQIINQSRVFKAGGVSTVWFAPTVTG